VPRVLSLAKTSRHAEPFLSTREPPGISSAAFQPRRCASGAEAVFAVDEELDTRCVRINRESRVIGGAFVAQLWRGRQRLESAQAGASTA
jgi:hypothetical protein